MPLRILAEQIQRARFSRLLKSASASSAAKLSTMLAGLVTLPVAAGNLSKAELGVYVTITTIVILLSFTNLGVGNGLVSQMAGGGSDSHQRDQRLLSSAWAVLLTWSSFLVLLVSALTLAVKVPDELPAWVSLQESTVDAVLLTLLVVCVDIPLSLTRSVRLAQDQMVRNSVWMIGCSCFQIFGSMVVVQLGGGIVWLVAIFVIAYPLSDLGNTLDWWINARRAGIQLTLVAADRATVKSLMSSGGLFTLLAVIGAVAYQSDVLVIARYLDSESVADFAVPFRLFSSSAILISMAMTPLWPAYAEAQSRGDFHWVRRTLKLSLVLSIGANALVGCILVLLGPDLVRIWVGGTLHPERSLLWMMFVYMITVGASQPYAMVLNGLNLVREQVVMGVVMAVVNLVLSIQLVKSLGVEGTLIATIVAQSVFVLVPCFFIVRRRLAPYLSAVHGVSEPLPG